MDRSSYGHSSSASTNGYGNGHDTGMSVNLDSGSSFSVGSALTSFNISVMTIKMWIKPMSMPTAGTRAGLLDSGGRYRMFLMPSGVIRCAITGGPDLLTPANVVQVGMWRRVACTFNGTTTRIYVDGVQVATLMQTATIPSSTAGLVNGHNNPTGENFVGAPRSAALRSP